MTETRRDLLEANMALFPCLPAEARESILRFVDRFIDGKSFYFHPSLPVDDRMPVIVAANAALVGAAQPVDGFSSVRWLYFCGDDLEPDGDALGAGTVRLRADRCLEESQQIVPGRNLVVHEFAHVLDALFALSGSTRALNEAHEQFRDRLYDDGCNLWSNEPIDVCHDVDFDEYTEFCSAEEFFSIASESFFTVPAQIRAQHPALYADLQKLYGLDMAEIVPE